MLKKNQAYLNRTMEAAAPFAGATAQYMETLAGKQGEYSQAMRETQVAYAEALEPTLMKVEEFKTNAVSMLADFISSNEAATAGVTTFITTLGLLAIAIGTVKKAYDAYKTSTFAATVATQGFTAALAINPFRFNCNSNCWCYICIGSIYNCNRKASRSSTNIK